ncbi:HEPN domain-containing protein [Arcobacter sp. FWKO B]|uniref:HEPN domain-containing protein n=1 Tax=Arcobacter sp. FWKO B TaxID=2593672 RepID=UPI0018A54ADD|nr:HEPN domain-containing protein [Arcobacter sp. FWKO B]QOG11969.1 HEPN domain-containing protein [Arcobacter sp. FWKO B]
MANKTYANEWIEKAFHDLDSANILFISGHYTDTIGYLYHQALEKMFKSLIAYQNKPIEKTHNLIELHEMLSEYFDFDEDELMLLAIATTYHTKQRYPAINKTLPSKEEIQRVKKLSDYIFKHICSILDVNKSDFDKI